MRRSQKAEKIADSSHAAGSLYNRLVEFSGDAIYRYTFDGGKILFANAGFVKVLDLDCLPEELTGKLLKDVLIYTEVPGALRSMIDKNEEIHDFEYHFKTLKGDDRWVIHNSFIVMDNVTGEKVVEAIAKDVTERKRIKDKMARIATVLHSAKNVTQLILREKDPKKTIQLICDTLTERDCYRTAWIVLSDEHGRFTSYSQSGLGEGFTTVIKRLKKGECQNCWNRTMSQTGVLVFKDPFNECRDCPILNEKDNEGIMAVRLEIAGNIFGIFVISAPKEFIVNPEEQALFEQMAGDITFCLREMKVIVDKKMAYDALEGKVRERTKELTEGQTAMLYMIEDLNEQAKKLQDAQEKLVRSEKLAVLGKLAGAVSHELRNPLGVIRNSIYFLKMRLGQALTDEKVKKHLSILEEEISISDRIIDDILTFGRLKEPVLSEHKVNDIIKRSIERSRIPGNITVELKLGRELPAITVDPDQLMRVFSNIITNAIQAMGKSGSLTIASVEMNDFIEITFADTGPGISKEDMEKIFEPLFSTKAKGTGLGLSICQSIIMLHKGDIRAVSDHGKGAKFVIRLPITGGGAG
ncbi:MAG: ATP-binding protein [Candidatus Omnitrophota bacterium]